jgi:steroid delta-isomerase-like uncharacterized protein
MEGDAMLDQNNLLTTRKLCDAWNAHDAGRYAAMLDQSHVWESDTLPAPARGRQAAQEAMQMYVHAFPDLRFDIEQMLASGDHVVTRWRSTGHHRAELMGISPTNRRAEIHGCTVSEFKHGKVAHAWVYWDTGHLLRQLGALRSPHG